MRALLLCLLLGGCKDPDWEFRAHGEGQVRCACSPTHLPGAQIEHPTWADSEWAHQRNMRIVVEAVAMPPDAGVR